MSDPGTGVTFRRYLADRITDYIAEDPDVDVDDLQNRFLEALKHYGYTLDDVIPGTFEQILSKHIL